MNSPLHKPATFVMALLVLFSTMSFSIEKHMCGSMVVDTAIFSHAKSCGAEANVCGEGMSAMGSCCSNEKTTVEGQDELKISWDTWKFEQQVFVATWIFSGFSLYENLRIQEVPFEHYSPPLLVTDLLILDQVFRI